MDIQNICRLCFKTDIQKQFINALNVPGLVQEMSMVYDIEVSTQNGISTLVCADCHNKTIVVTSHLDAVRKTQAKIAEVKVANEKSSAGNSDNQPASNKDNTGLAKVLKELRQGKKNKNRDAKENEKRSDPQVNHFEVGEEVSCYDIHLKKNINAVVVNRVTYGQYAIRTGHNNRVVLRRAIFLSKK